MTTNFETASKFVSGAPGMRRNTKVQANGVRKDALISGTAWTVILAVPLFLFKSSPARPISLLPLAAAGAVWRAILVDAAPDRPRAARDGG
jgi:hypothetical protein